ncbi:dual specificity tyrosine-phosphorylation regulated kinase [Histoplasma capsulatum G186AR]|uniref:Dual specificity tyrosine-phosphorylation regulated kinase n=1 Tax=Ajellomyces capsulatus TaxID=5037 RepID=A0A8H7YQR7_AJECA|nr:dual specificity tyrosine-phosphorylation regulated kinase [Histoplasma capsulatum]QSS75391.1 dual specificity tyrosine-phosphorylation regulated kinase [Histoplasma capsulatum G186AR]
MILALEWRVLRHEGCRKIRPQVASRRIAPIPVRCLLGITRSSALAVPQLAEDNRLGSRTRQLAREMEIL